MLESVVLLDSIVVREGVIIDTVNGGIGFRNHTVPVEPTIRHSATWTEDILWIELMTSCVDTNWTIEIFQAVSSSSTPSNIWLGNRGGGITSDRTPRFTPFDNSNPQLNPDLEGRAHLGASMFGYILSAMLNLTAQNASNTGYNVDSNDDIFLSLTSLTHSSTGLAMGGIFDLSYGYFFTPPPIVSLDPGVFNLSAFNVSQFEDYLSTVIIREASFFPPAGGLNFSDSRKFGPFIAVRLNNAILTIIEVTACQGLSADDTPNIHRIDVSCGYMVSPLPSSDASHVSGAEERINQSIYICASAPRAIVKEVSFRYNGTGVPTSLSNLTVTEVADKRYLNATEKPVWGVENPGKQWNISSIHLLWGIVDGSRFQTSDSLWTIQSESLYLPASYEDELGFESGDSMASIYVLSSCS
jgi:hypothetical protein